MVKKHLQFIFSILISAIFLYFVLYKPGYREFLAGDSDLLSALFGNPRIDLNDFVTVFSSLNLWYAISAGIMLVLTLFLRAWRWQRILLQVGSCPYWVVFHSVNLGYLLNNVLPMRAGEVMRAMIVARKSKIPFTSVATTVILERIFDIGGLVITFGVTIAAFPFPQWLRAGGATISIGFGTTLLVLFLLSRRQQAVIQWLNTFSEKRSNTVQKVSNLIAGLLEGVSVLRSGKEMFHMLWSTVALWTVYVLTMQFVMTAFGFTDRVYAYCSIDDNRVDIYDITIPEEMRRMDSLEDVDHPYELQVADQLVSIIHPVLSTVELHPLRNSSSFEDGIHERLSVNAEKFLRVNDILVGYSSTGSSNEQPSGELNFFTLTSEDEEPFASNAYLHGLSCWTAFENQVYAVDTSGTLSVYSILTGERQQYVGVPSTPDHIAVSGDILCLGYNPVTLAFASLNNSVLTVESTVELPSRIVNLHSVDDILYATVDDGDIEILDFSRINEPLLTSTISTGASEIQDVAIHGGYLYVTLGNNGLQVYDTTNPEHPVLLSAISNGFTYKEIEVTGGYPTLSGSVWLPGAVLTIITTLGLAIPSAPGGIGTYHAFALLGLALYNVPEGVSVVYATFVHAQMIIMLNLMGFVGLFGLGLSWSEVMNRVKSSDAGTEEDNK